MATLDGFGRPADVPWWVGLVLLPLLNLLAAFVIAGVPESTTFTRMR